DALDQALAVYRATYKPSEEHPKPYAGAAINLFAADTQAEGERLRRGMLQGFIFLRRGQHGPLKPPVDDLHDIAQPQEIAMAESVLREAAVGTKDAARTFIERFLERTKVDELILTCHAQDQG